MHPTLCMARLQQAHQKVLQNHIPFLTQEMVIQLPSFVGSRAVLTTMGAVATLIGITAHKGMLLVFGAVSRQGQTQHLHMPQVVQITMDPQLLFIKTAQVMQHLTQEHHQ